MWLHWKRSQIFTVASPKHVQNLHAVGDSPTCRKPQFHNESRHVAAKNKRCCERILMHFWILSHLNGWFRLHYTHKVICSLWPSESSNSPSQVIATGGHPSFKEMGMRIGASQNHTHANHMQTFRITALFSASQLFFQSCLHLISSLDCNHDHVESKSNFPHIIVIIHNIWRSIVSAGVGGCMISQVDWSWPTSAELLNVLDIAADPPLLLAVFEAPQPTTATVCMHQPGVTNALTTQERFSTVLKSLPFGLVFVCLGKT